MALDGSWGEPLQGTWGEPRAGCAGQLRGADADGLTECYWRETKPRMLRMKGM